jgi:hypothetical protein
MNPRVRALAVGQGSDPGAQRAEARAAAVAHPHLAACIAPAAAFLAGAAGQLLLQHRPALALIPVAVLRAVVVAAAGDRIIAVAAAPATAAAPAAGLGELGAAAVADPDRAVAHAPGAAFIAGAAGQLADQAGIAPADRAAALAVVLALAADGFAGTAVVAAPATAIATAPAAAGSTNSARQPLVTQMLPLRLPQVRPSSQALPDSWRTSCALRQPVLQTRSRLFWLSQRITPFCAAAERAGQASTAPRLRVTARLARDSGFMAASHTVAGARL